MSPGIYIIYHYIGHCIDDNAIHRDSEQNWISRFGNIDELRLGCVSLRHH